ncbi:MAG: carbohydrate ABC transporter permease [Treponema sp.]|jgi:raffinose/stachyose/melibiose transport system permease protein|nr:carbohydrate ABC transporter permease [Treponema sp.]
MNKRGFSPSSLFLNVILIFLSVTCVYPVIWLIYSSVKTDADFMAHIFGLPGLPLQWNNYYAALIRSKILNYFFNTLFNGFSSVLVIIFFAFCIGYVLARYRFKGKLLVELILMIGMIVPVHSLLVPMYIQFKLINIVDRRGVLIFPYVGIMLPLSVFLIRAYIRGLPASLEESAEIEGAGLASTLILIIVPVAKPILVTVGVIVFNFVWNEMPFSLILNASDKVRNIAVGIMNFASSYDVKWTLRIAACVISLIPVMLLYGLFNKQIVQSSAEGSVKG